MQTFLIIIAFIQSFSISLGVGSSTLAVTNFFVAIADGSISPDERRMMGIVYVVLRIAMVAILVSTLIIQALTYGTVEFVTYNMAQLFVILILFANAMLMTAHLIPSNFGPAIQAGNWYTLGILSAMVPLGLTQFSLTNFFLVYVTWLVLAVSIVNGIMAIQVAKRKKLLK